MRWRITLLVAATTSLVLLAFLIPAGYLVARVAHNNAVSRGQLQVQALIPVLALSSASGTTVAVQNVADAGYLVWVTASGAPTIGTDPAGKALDGSGLSRADVTEVDPTGAAPGGVLIAQPVTGPGGSSVIRLLVTDAQLSAGVTRIWLVLGGIGLLLFVLSLLVADWFARSMSRPITALAGTAGRLGSGDLDARVTPAGPPEVARVGVALNRLGGRIGELLTAERESVADLSHRLRTPITALRLDAEAVSDPAQRQRLSDDLRGLDEAVDEIIRTARRATAPGSCDAAAVVRDRMVFWGVLASHQDRGLEVAVDPAVMTVDLAATDLAAALDALVGNVFAHTQDGTAFEVRCRTEADAVVVSVIDSGPGFDLTRADRGESGGGSTGLGLDIARQAAAETDGRLVVERRPDGRTEIRMELGKAISSP